MEMFLVAVGFYGIGVLTMLLPHGMQRAAHWLANSAALFSGQQHQHHRHDKQAPHTAQKAQTAALIATRITKRIQAGNNTGDTGQKQKDCAPAIAA